MEKNGGLTTLSAELVDLKSLLVNCVGAIKRKEKNLNLDNALAHSECMSHTSITAQYAHLHPHLVITVFLIHAADLGPISEYGSCVFLEDELTPAPTINHSDMDLWVKGG